MIAAMGVIAFKPKPSRPPPLGTAGTLGWLHANLFYSWWSTFFTLVAGYIAASVLIYLYNWGIADAVWQADSRRECLDESPHGACWAGIKVWLGSFLYGRYPASERWRINLTFALLVLWLIPLTLPRVRAKPSIAASAALTFPFLAGFLLAGGERGWLMHVMVALGVSAFSLSWLHVAMCLGRGRSLSSWFYDVTGLDRKNERARKLAVVIAYVVLTAGAAQLLSSLSLLPIRTNLWGGLFITFLIAGVGIAVSLPGGILLALTRRSKMPFMRACVIAYIELVRSVPLVTVLFFAVTMMPFFLPRGVELDKLVLVLVAVSLFAAAYMAEVIRGGLQAVPLGQFEAAQSIGLGYWHMMGLVVLPQALRHMIPNIASQYIGLLKDTTIVSIVGLYDFLLMLRASGQNPIWIGFHIEPFVFGGAVFFLLCFSISRYSKALERRGSGIVGADLKAR